MAFCTYCGQQFQRNEHLERHLITHTNIKRFKCDKCHVSFARADVLQRHVAIHGDANTMGTNGAIQGVIKVRARTQNACRNCARMKAKCDTNTPCNRCKARQIDCDRRPKKRRAPAPESRTPNASSDATRESDDEVGDDTSPTPMEIEQEVENGLGNESREDCSPEETRQDPSDDSNGYSEAALQGETTSQENRRPSTPGAELGAYIVNVSDNTFHGHLSLPEVNHSSLESTLEGWITNPSMMEMHLGDFSKDSAAIIQSASDGLDSNGYLVSQNFRTPNDRTMSEIFGEHQQRHERQWKFPPPPTTEAPEHHAVLQAQDYWSTFQCNPRKDIVQCPRTAGVLLESLSHMPESDRLWGWLNFDFPSPASIDGIVSLPLLENVRDKLSAISQSFLRKALEVHRLDPAAAASSYPSPAADVSPGFLILPPAATLEHFLREYMRLFEPFYRLVPGGVFDANTLMNGSNNSASSLLILLMVSQGAMSDPTGEARRLSGGLTEVCRISLFDTIEKHVSLCHHQLLIHSSLLFIIQAAWSGDKWLMDIGLGQRGIYIAIIRNGGLFDTELPDAEIPEEQDTTDLKRTRWLERERLLRLIYAWVVLDLELSLFQNVNPLIPVTQLRIPLPSCVDLFLANETSMWEQLLAQKEEINHQVLKQPSLCTLFQWFLNDDLGGQRRQHLNPTTLRLLLHPLHALVLNLRQLLTCFGDGGIPRSFSPVTKKSTDLRMEEIHSLLHRWWDLYKPILLESRRESDSNEFDSPSITVGLITYHVISLNVVADIAEIENLARRRVLDKQLQLSLHAAARCIQDYEEAMLHAGQILYLIRSFDKKIRPPWWPAALYRATIVLWAISVFYGSLWKVPASTHVFIDSKLEEDRLSFVTQRSIITTPGAWNSDGRMGTPVLTDQNGGDTPVMLDDPIRTLECCLRGFGNGVATRLSEGVQRKLRQFLESRYVCREG